MSLPRRLLRWAVPAALGLSLAGCESPQREAPPGLFGDASRAAAEARKGARGQPVVEGQAPTGQLTEAEIYEGTGAFTDPSAIKAQVELRSGTYTMNFVEADVRQVIDAVLGDALDANYVIDPKVTGTITARTARPLPREQVIPALEDILAMHSVALIEDGGLYRVLPMSSAGIVAPVSPGKRPKGHGFGLHVIPLSYVSADAMMAALSKFVAPGRDLQADPGRNLLIFRGPGAEARDLVGIVELFDVDWMAGMSFALLPLNSADATDVVVELETIFGQDGEGPEAMRGMVRFLPVERMNAVLAMSEQSQYLNHAQVWVKRLDRGGSEDQRQLYVYHVSNARADDIAAVLAEMFDVRTVGAQQPRAEVALGRGTGRLGGGTPVPEGAGADRAAEGAAVGRQGALAEGMRRTARAAGGGRTDFAATLAGDGTGPRIIADARNDALLILATAQEYRMIESTVKRLDLVPLQVLIEATIAEVTLTDTLRYGLRWFFEEDGGQTRNSFTFSDFADGAVAQTFPGFSYLLDGADVRATLNLLSQITDVNVVSSPQLMVLDNGVARLQVGDQVPVPIQQSVSVVDPDAPIVNSIRFEDTGVILEVSPHVNANGLVVLEVRQEVSDVVPTRSSGIDAPTIQQRVIESSVAVQTGETIALGGLIRDSRSIGVTGVPFLKDIPVLGNLFKSKDRLDERTELLVLLTPQVVRDSQEARSVTAELRRRLKGLAQLRETFEYDVKDEVDDFTAPPLEDEVETPPLRERLEPPVEQRTEAVAPQGGAQPPLLESEQEALPSEPSASVPRLVSWCSFPSDPAQPAKGGSTTAACSTPFVLGAQN